MKQSLLQIYQLPNWWHKSRAKARYLLISAALIRFWWTVTRSHNARFWTRYYSVDAVICNQCGFITRRKYLRHGMDRGNYEEPEMPCDYCPRCDDEDIDDL